MAGGGSHPAGASRIYSLIVLSVIGILALTGLPAGPGPASAQAPPTSAVAAAEPGESVTTEPVVKPPPSSPTPTPAVSTVPARTGPTTTASPRPTMAPRPPGKATVDRDSLRVGGEIGDRFVTARVVAPEQGGRLGGARSRF